MGRSPKDGFISACRSRQLAREKIQKILGHQLPDYLTVHHINGNPFDNDIQNLKILGRSDHSRLHFQEWWNRFDGNDLGESLAELEIALMELNNQIY